jgi:type I restriction enzyme, S subunit
MAVRVGYQQTEVGVIPEDWDVIPVSYFGETKRGAGSLSIKYKSSGGVRLIRINDFFQDNPVFVEPTDDIMRFQLQERDLLFAGTGASAGASFLPKKDWIGLPHSYNAPRIRVFEGKSKEYLLYSLKSDYVRKQQRAWFVGNAQPFLDTKAISSFSIALPPTLPEQKAIATALSDADTLIAAQEGLIAKKRQIKQGAMQELLTGKRRLPGFEKKAGYKKTDVGIIPNDWEVKLLPDICLFRGGKAHEQYISNTEEFICVNSKFISTEGSVRKYSTKNFCSAKKGDILMVMSDLPNGRALAKAFLADQNDLYAVNQRVCALTPYMANSEYLFYVLDRNSYFLKFDNGVSQTHLLNPVFQKCPLPIPSLIAEQEAIGKVLSDMDAEIDMLAAKLSKTRQVKQGMMSQLLTGKVRLV